MHTMMARWLVFMFGVAFIPRIGAVPCYLNTTTCVPVTTTTCFSAKISFSHTSLAFVNTSVSSQEEVRTHLDIWANLRRVPECWAVIQPYLCSVYVPRCNIGDQTVEQPNRELCERIRDPCQVVMRYNGSWPSFLQCDQNFLAESCGQTHFETSMFNTEGECIEPLIVTTEESNWYKTLQGCGIQCENPLYTQEEHTVVHIWVAVLGGICVLSTLFTVLTFVIDWKTGRKYPAVILFFINGCFLVASLGWLAQFINRDDIICRKDGTIRKGEPLIGSGETASCTVVFILVYYFTLAGVVWFVMLAYSWDIHFKALGTVRDDLSKKTSYFHIGSWCLPLVMTIVCLSMSEIDADSLSGVCFPGFFDSVVRTGFVLVPIALVLLLGTVFCIRGLLTLIRVKKDSPSVVSDRATAKIGETIIRLGLFLGLIVMLTVTSFSVHAYTFSKDSDWQTSFEEYVYCKANVSVMQMFENVSTSSCELRQRPSVVVAMLHVFTFFGAGILMSSWSWTRSSLEAWHRLFRRVCNKPINKPQKLRKHRVIAKAFKRQKKRNNERLSVSYGTDHDDPIGMKFDLNSNSSHSMSSGFAMAIPKSRHRRGVINPGFRRSRRHSDSDIGSLGSKIASSRRVSSRSSRRESYESSMSQKLSDIEREIRHEERRKRRRKRRKKRQNRIQPLLEPISSNMMALQQRRLGSSRRRHRSDSSDLSRTSTHKTNLPPGWNMVKKNGFIGSSNVLSEATTNSVSEIDQEQQHHQQLMPKITDFSMFTANAMLPPTDREDRDNNGSQQQTTNLKGAKSSPSGSFRRGRRREVKLEMTETSFYQEDDDNIEVAGNQTVHCEENCQETGEIRGNNLRELGPLVSEIFEQARANSSRNSNMGSSRLGSASSRGSRGSRKSLPKDNLKYATTKVNLPDRPSGPKSQKRPFSGDYVLANRKEDTRRNHETRKSQSNPSSRASSATHHKRQIGHNGRIDFTEGLNWSRFLQEKGHVPGQLFAFPPTFKGNMPSVPVYSFQGPHPGQLQIMDKSQLENAACAGQSPGVDVLKVEEEHRLGLHNTHDNPVKPLSPFVNILNVEDEQRKHQPRVDVLNIEQEHKRSRRNVDILNVEEEQKAQKGGVDILDVEAERHEYQRQLKRKHPLEKNQNLDNPRTRTVQNILNIEEEQKRKNQRKGSVSSGSRTSEYINSGSASSHSSRNVQYDGIQSGKPMDECGRLPQEIDEEFYRRIDQSSILPGLIDKRANLQDYLDYEIDSEYDDMTDDLTDTYTYTSYDDDLTEVSSLPC